MALINLAHEFDGLTTRGSSFDDWFYPSHRPRRHLGSLAVWPGMDGPVDHIGHWLNSRHLNERDAIASIGKDGLQVCLDMKQYKPNEITVKTVNNSIIIEGKHEERPDEHGYISRQFVRRYTLPQGYDENQVFSTLSSDGVLTIKAPPPKTSGANEKHIQIQHTGGPARLTIKQQSKDEIDGKKK